MSLKEIEYGSLASSADMNNNFMYLDNKIAEASETINTNISSILSNIATINSRLSDLAEDLQESVGGVSAELSSYKIKALNALNKVSMIPDWRGCSIVSNLNNFVVPKNGYLLILPDAHSKGNLTLNQKEVVFKGCESVYEYAAQLVAIPVCENDTVACTFTYSKAYFVPAFQITYESED